MYDSNQYESYDLAKPDGATYSTDSAITLESAADIRDITEVLQSAMGCIGYLLDSVRLGILKQGVFVPLKDVIGAIDSNRTGNVDHAIDFAYAALVDVTITFTRAEVVELTHRLNTSETAFIAGYKHSDKRTPPSADAIMRLYHKLNDISKVFERYHHD